MTGFQALYLYPVWRQQPSQPGEGSLPCQYIGSPAAAAPSRRGCQSQVPWKQSQRARAIPAFRYFSRPREKSGARRQLVGWDRGSSPLRTTEIDFANDSEQIASGINTGSLADFPQA